MTLTREAPTVAEYDLSAWDLGDLLPDASEEVVSRKLDLLHAAVDAFEHQRERLRGDLERGQFLLLLRQYEDLVKQADVIGGYASLWFSSNTQDSRALSFRNRMQQVLTQIQNRCLFFSLWWKGLDDEAAERLLPGEDLLEQAELQTSAVEVHDFRHYLAELRRFSPYTLDEKSEQIINIKNANGIDAVVTLYSMLVNRLEFELEAGGEKRTLTDGEIRSLFYSPDAKVREAVFRELFRVYGHEAKVLAQIYANRVRDWHNEHVELRGLPSAIAVRNLRNDIPDAAVDTLLEVTARNAPLFQRYFRLKAGWLGTEKLRRYDLYAPLATSDQKVPFRRAAADVLATFRRFDPGFAGLAERVFAERHIDSEVRKGKKGGAFCATLLPELTPWVLLSYTGKLRDVATLAHELGHAVHSMLANQHSVFTQHPSLPLAETASVFSEILMTDRLLAEATDPMVRREILASAVDDIYATVMRQTFFVRFELAAHQAVLDNQTGEDLCDLYLRNLEEQFGDSVELAPEFRYEWVAIPHLFNTPFYCYAYSFGQLLVLSLYRRYQEEGEAFKPGYLRLLAHGGAARPADVLAEMGIDIADPEFWQGGFAVVRGMIDELEALDLH